MLVKAKGELQAVAGSRLQDGLAVWLGRDGTWVERVEDAAAFRGDAIAAALDAAKAAERARVVVDCYPLDVDIRNGATVPLHVRERYKALGPSVRPDLGKQAEPKPAPKASVA